MNFFLRFAAFAAMAITMGLTAVSCDDNNTVIEKENTPAKLNKIEVKFKKGSIDLGGNTKLKFKDKKTALKKLKDINNDLKTITDKDKNLIGVVYSVTISKGEIEISNFLFNEFSSRIDQYTLEDEIADSYDCPSGQTLVKKCWSQSCVESVIANQFGDFNSGDTVGITVHHGGTFGGVSICSTK